MALTLLTVQQGEICKGEVYVSRHRECCVPATADRTLVTAGTDGGWQEWHSNLTSSGRTYWFMWRS